MSEREADAEYLGDEHRRALRIGLVRPGQIDVLLEDRAAWAVGTPRVMIRLIRLFGARPWVGGFFGLAVAIGFSMLGRSAWNDYAPAFPSSLLRPRIPRILWTEDQLSLNGEVDEVQERVGENLGERERQVREPIRRVGQQRRRQRGQDR